MGMTIQERFSGCILVGATGDAYGSAFENQAAAASSGTYYPFGKPRPKQHWGLTDDTQLTLATCEAILERGGVSAESIAGHFRSYHQAKKLTGLGGSTLKALNDLAAGAHWSQAGRRGEYAAGNGAAMRIAPLAFIGPGLNRLQIEEVSRITHYNDEAYAGALAVVLSLRAILSGTSNEMEQLLHLVAEQLPDTRVRDRLLELQALPPTISLAEVAARFGAGGYVVESVPLALLAASRVQQLGIERMFVELAAAGGDTDTNCSIAGQLAGALLGPAALPDSLSQQLRQLPEYPWILEVTRRFQQLL